MFLFNGFVTIRYMRRELLDFFEYIGNCFVESKFVGDKLHLGRGILDFVLQWLGPFVLGDNNSCGLSRSLDVRT